MHWLVNSWVAFSKDRTTDLLNELPNAPESLQEFDIVVLKFLNPLRGNSAYSQSMREMLEKHESMDASIKPPVLTTMAKAMPDSLIIGVSMFTKPKVSVLHSFQTMAAKLKHTVMIDSRTHIERLGECAASARKYQVNECLSVEAESNGHRCSGRFGGIPDVVTWDVIEAIHEPGP